LEEEELDLVLFLEEKEFERVMEDSGVVIVAGVSVVSKSKGQAGGRETKTGRSS